MSLTDLTFQNPTDLVNRTAFNERFSRLNEALFNSEGNVVDILGNLVGTRVETGSYVGTGTSGSSNPNSLTLGFDPKIVIVNSSVGLTSAGATSGSTYCHSLLMFIGSAAGLTNILGGYNNQAFSNTSSNSTNFITFSGNSVSWYAVNSSNRAVIQLNVSGVTYNYIAIG